MHYVLHRISKQPAHGYEILQDIDSKTEGAWRPGAGSIYPMLKKLVQEGYITTDGPGKSSGDSQHVYMITPKGKLQVREANKMFASIGQRWSAMRRIFLEMLEPSDTGKFIVESSKTHFQMAQDAFESKASGLSSSEAEYILKEYVLNLERQLSWAKNMLEQNQSGKARVVPVHARRVQKEISSR